MSTIATKIGALTPTGSFAQTMQKHLAIAASSPQFGRKVFGPAGENSNGRSAYADRNIRIDISGTRRVLQINNQVDDAGLKAAWKKYGSHESYGNYDVEGQTGTEEDILNLVQAYLDYAEDMKPV